jgi:hypothetical protein
METKVQQSQADFLRRGGMFRLPMDKMIQDGTLQDGYTFREYPRAITIVNGPPREVERSTDTCDKKTITWKEMVPNVETIIVASEEEEERVLAGGRTSTQIEDERQGLLARCRNMGLAADPSWSTVRLKRTLGDSLDAPAPADEMDALKAKMAKLEEMAAMKARIAELEAQLAAPVSAKIADMLFTDSSTAEHDDPEELRGQLAALGVTVDRRWGQARLRDELERATAPKAA